MDKQAFKRAQELLVAAGLKIDEAGYDPSTFGSWLVAVHAMPRHRLVWDGKDGWFIVQRETSRMLNGLRVWKDLWIASEEKDLVVELAVNQLCQFARQPRSERQ